MAEGPVSVSIVKGQVEAVEKKLHKAASHDVLAAIRKAITQDTLPARKRIRAAALGTLPHKGGLNKWAAVLPTSIVRQEGKFLTVRIRMQRGKHDFKSLDAGRIRHPLFGNRKKWFEQNIPSGFFTKQTERLASELRHDVAEAINQYAAQFNKPGKRG